MIRKFLKFTSLILAICFLGSLFAFSAQASDKNHTCLIYFTGIGCLHCARTDAMILEQLPREYPNLIVIEYEIYELKQNAPLLDEYDSTYQSGFEIPLIIFNQEQHISGDITILKNIRGIIEELDFNKCPLIDGSCQDFSALDVTFLPGYPKIWHQDRILIKLGPEGDSELLKKLLVGDNLPEILAGVEFKAIEPIEVVLSGKDVEFDNGILIGDWIFQWNGEGIGVPPSPMEVLPEAGIPPSEVAKPKLTLLKIASLAVVDAINPCAFAVLLLMLTTILVYSPGNRRNLLLVGLAFITSIFVMYFTYGLVIIKFFQVIQALTPAKFWLFKILGGVAIIFGVLNIWDFIKYRPGRLGTEMPLFLRPKVRKIISRVTSPKGAFLVGVFVTIFLLPCTIGPYIIAAGILSVSGMLENIPLLLLYNLIFVLPMLIIVGSVYQGLRKVEDVSSWKERNIRKLHLVAGVIILGLGVAMCLGLV